MVISTSSTMISTTGAVMRAPSRMNGTIEGSSTFSTPCTGLKCNDRASSTRAGGRRSAPACTVINTGQMAAKTTTWSFMLSV